MNTLNTYVTRPGFAKTQVDVRLPNQVQNNAGSFVYSISDMERVERFLLLGTDSTYYQTGSQLTRENADFLVAMLRGGKHKEIVDMIVRISDEGLAAKQDPGLFALALASVVGEVSERQYALAQLSKVARTGSTLISFIVYRLQFAGWGSAFRKAITAWYKDKDVDSASYQVVKYRSRLGYTHKDIFYQAHITSVDSSIRSWLFKNIVEDNASKYIVGLDKALKAPTKELPRLIEEYDLTWEMLPTQALKEKVVWEALLDNNRVPLTALIRNLPTLTELGLLEPLADRTFEVIARLTDSKELERARIHPIALLTAKQAYSTGRASYGNKRWTPTPSVEEALEKAFYLAYKAVTPSNKKFMVALDISGSMWWDIPDGSNFGLSAADIGVAMSLVIANTEPKTHIVGFSSEVIPLNVTASDSLDSANSKVKDLNFGYTDPSKAFQYAIDNKLDVDTFLVITDNEVNSGSHVSQKLEKYRRVMNKPDAKFIILATSATRFSLGDPNDPHTLNLAGFDSSIPKAITAFSK